MTKNRPSYIRKVRSRLKGQNLLDPKTLLTPRRLDIAAKTYFARAYLEGSNSSWPDYVYKEHIRAFNNFYEKEPVKNGYEDFRNSFINIINNTKNAENWKSKSPVLVNDKFLMNGAHRVAASIVLNDRINAINPEKTYSANWGFEFFRSNRPESSAINEDVLDYMTIEYVSLKKSNVFVAVVFPSAEGYRKEVYDHFMKLGEIINIKTFSCDEFIGKEVIKQLYTDKKKDQWNIGQGYEGATEKASYCFNGNGDLQVYVIEANLDETSRIAEKEYLRSVWRKDKHSIHITDTIEEANRVVRMFFNENSRRLLKVDKSKEFFSTKASALFEEYKKNLPNNIIERDKCAIEGSMVLDLLGLRKANDLDYISNSKLPIKQFVGDIEEHRGVENEPHELSIDEIISNPKYYFFYKGYKFIDVVQLRIYKNNRYLIKTEDKDLNDVKLIDRFLLENYQYDTIPPSFNKVSKKPKFSLVIPLYNKAKYISKCIVSIQNQSFTEWECIIVDDGSTDGSSSIVKRFTNNDLRIKLVNQKNRGPSVARNKGLNLANGEFVQFIDADDYLSNDNVLSEINSLSYKMNYKIYSGLIGIKESNGDVLYELSINKSVNKEILFNELDNEYYMVRFFFDRQFLIKNNIKFPEYTRVGEDPVFLVKALTYAKKFYATDVKVYTYNTPVSSNSKLENYSSDTLLAYMRAQLETLALCKAAGNIYLKKSIIERINYISEVYIAKSDDDRIKDMFKEILAMYDADDILSLAYALSSVKKDNNYLRENNQNQQLIINRYTHPGLRLAVSTLKEASLIKINYLYNKTKAKIKD